MSGPWAVRQFTPTAHQRRFCSEISPAVIEAEAARQGGRACRYRRLPSDGNPPETVGPRFEIRSVGGSLFGCSYGNAFAYSARNCASLVFLRSCSAVDTGGGVGRGRSGRISPFISSDAVRPLAARRIGGRSGNA